MPLLANKKNVKEDSFSTKHSRTLKDHMKTPKIGMLLMNLKLKFPNNWKPFDHCHRTSIRRKKWFRKGKSFNNSDNQSVKDQRSFSRKESWMCSKELQAMTELWGILSQSLNLNDFNSFYGDKKVCLMIMT